MRCLHSNIFICARLDTCRLFLKWRIELLYFAPDDLNLDGLELYAAPHYAIGSNDIVGGTKSHGPQCLQHLNYEQ